MDLDELLCFDKDKLLRIPPGFVRGLLFDGNHANLYAYSR